jgi:hypothetical protein
MCSGPFETRSLPSSLAATHRDFALITRTARCLRQLPSCVAVYPRESQSRRVLCRFSQSSIRPLGFPIYVARVPTAPFTLSARELAKDRFGEPPKPGRRGDRSREFAAIVTLYVIHV